jgi:hypothetical protein
MSEELKACPNPNCKQHDSVHTITFNVDVEEIVLPKVFAVWQASCVDGGTAGPIAHTKDEAIAGWNLLPRVPDPLAQELVQALVRAEIGDACDECGQVSKRKLGCPECQFAHRSNEALIADARAAGLLKP